MTDRPTREEFDRAWSPLESLTGRHSSVHAWACQHADGQLSELTAKLGAVDALRNQVRRLKGQDCGDGPVRIAVQLAVHGPADAANLEFLHTLMVSLGQQVETLMRQRNDELDRFLLSSMRKRVLIFRPDEDRSVVNRTEFLREYGFQETDLYLQPIANQTAHNPSNDVEKSASTEAAEDKI